jgi:nicotinamide-nucleotide amidase
VLKVSDIGESAVDDRIGDLIANSDNPTVGVLAHPGQVDVRITARADSRELAAKLIDPVEAKVRGLLGENIFAVDDETIASVTGKLLTKSGVTIATCEDLSGGAVADAVRDAADTLFVEGVVLNSNEALERMARAGGETPPFESGEARAKALARAVRKLTGAKLGLVAHAVAEGDQRAENLGKGETYIALASDSGERVRHVRSAGKGRPDRQRAAMHSLSMVRRQLLGLPD